MKKLTKFFIAIMLTLSYFAVDAQNYIQYGTGYTYTSYYYFPWYNYYKTNRSQQMYMMDELGSDPIIITALSYNYQRVTPASDYEELPNFQIDLGTTSQGNFVSNGQWETLNNLETVFTHPNYVPATTTGWNYIDIEDYVYLHNENLVVDISWGQMPNYCSYSNYYREYKNYRYIYYLVKYRYSDAAPPLTSPSVTYYRSNIRFYYETLPDPGTIEGYVVNCDGLPIYNAYVYAVDFPQYFDITDHSGWYQITMYSGDRLFEVYKEGFYPEQAWVTIPEGGTVVKDWTLTDPDVNVNPLLYDVTVNPNEYYETALGILNTGCGQLDWFTEIVYTDDDAAGGFHKVVSEELRTLRPDPSADYSPTIQNIEGPPASRDAWDYQFDFPVTDINAGAESDGEFIYGTWWSGAGVHKYELDGTYIGMINIPGTTNLRDLAYDPSTGYMYGGQATNTCWEMDFANEALINTFTAPGPVRAIGFNQDDNTLYANNWSTDIIEFDLDGGYVGQFACGPHGSLYGLAYDKWSDDGPYLWSYSQSGDVVCQYDLATGTETGFTFAPIGTGIAGGLYTQSGVFETGIVTIGGCAQNDLMWGYELAPGGGGGGPTGWLTMDYYLGTAAPMGGTDNPGVNFDATGLPSGTVVTANIILSTFPNVGTITIPATMRVAGEPLGMIEEIWAEITSMVQGTVLIEWTPAVSDDITFLHYVLKRDNQPVGTTTATSYTDQLPDFGTYCYEVQAVYQEGNSAPAGPACVDWFIPTIFVDPTVVAATVWEDEMITIPDAIAITNIGQQGSVLQFTFDSPTGFIYSVFPAQGSLPSGSSQFAGYIYSAEGYSAGVYNLNHDVNSNDPITPSVTIQHTMTVIAPGMFEGQVKDCNTGLPLKGAMVSAGPHAVMTDNNGEYVLRTDPGTWDVMFTKPGYKAVAIYNQNIVQGQTIAIDTCLYEFPYPPQFVTATVNDDDDECLVEWGLPAGPYTIVYDDGTAENMFVWQEARGENAVKFTPAGYPCMVSGGQFFLGYNFPLGGNIIGTDFGVVVYDDDGPGGMPGTQLDSIGVVVTNTGWFQFTGLNAYIMDGDFYLSMVQGGYPPNTAGIGIDEEIPTAYRSYTKPGGMDWMVSPYQDFMMRAIVDGPQGTLDDDAALFVVPTKLVPDLANASITLHTPIPYTGGKEGVAEYKPMNELEAERSVVKYRVIRSANFDPDDPNDHGNMTTLTSNNTDNDYLDMAFGGLAMGWYKYGVSANFTNGDWSDTAWSNIVGHLMDYPVTFYVSTTDGESPEGAFLQFIGEVWPYEAYTATVPADGIVTFESVWRGEYIIDCFLSGYARYLLNNVYHIQEQEIYIVLEETTYPPRNLWVDPLTSIAYWDMPLYPPTMIAEDFEAGVMPEGWTTWSSGNTEWFITQDGSSAYFNIPAHTWYACTNDDGAGSANNGCCDYLATPVIDMREYTDYIMRFESFYNGAYSQSAYVEFSTNGEDFFPLMQLSANSAWTEVIVDLASICGPTGSAYTWLAFHADDNGTWASGWAVDDVFVASATADGGGADSLNGYQVFLDGAYVASTPATQYQYVYLIYGQVYTAGVAAEFSSGLSAMITYTFMSEYLIPPRNLAGEPFDNSAYLTWDPPIYPTYSAPPVAPNMISFENQTHSLLPATEIAEPANVEPLFVNTHGSNSRDEGPIGWMNDVLNNQWMTIDVTTYGTTTIGPTTFQCFAGDYPRDFENIMYASNYGAGEALIEIDVATGTATTIGSLPCPLSGSGGIWTGFACDKANGTMYAMCTDIAQSMLCTIETGTGAVTQIGTTTTAPGVIECAFNAETGIMYGWCIVNDACYTIDLATGEATLLGPLGVNLNYAQGGSWNPWDDEVYLTAYAASGEFRILDQATGATTLLTALTSEMACFGFPGLVGGGTGGEIPSNLIGYNIYRWGDSIARVVHHEEPPPLEYYDFDLWPAVYEYTITAIYDLTPYGFTGEGESMHEGPVYVTVSFGYPLPFFEPWDLGTFEANVWEHGDCGNWVINAQVGDPAPSAEFKWDEPLTYYRCPLISYPLLGSEIIDGDIFVDFDLKLDDRYETGNERLTLSLWIDGQFYNVDDWNNEGSFDWTTHSVEITTIAKGHDFRLAFIAEGDSSINIQAWYVDNIHVYRVCAAALNVESENFDDEYVEITWVAPGTVVGEWLSYNDGSFENGFASTNGGYGLGQLFVMDDFPSVTYPFTITEVRYFNDDYQSYEQQEEIYVLTGDGAEILAGPYFIEDGPAADWVNVPIDPVVISEGNFMVATINTLAGGPFIGVDDSYYNGTLYFGTVGDWTELGELGAYYYVGSHEAYVETEVGGTVVINSNNAAPKPGSITSTEIVESYSGGIPSATNSSRDLLGFNVYRSINYGDWEMINEELVLESPYLDYDMSNGGGMYCYYVVAVYDQCESDSSNNTCVEVTVGVPEYGEDGIAIYPNPASDVINIVSSFDISKISVMNYVGQLVDELKTVEDNIIELNVSSYEEGVYFIKIETTKGIVTKKVTKIR